jgi:uncharacterized protein YcfL
MRKYGLVILATLMGAGCSSMPERQSPVCTASAMIGGQMTTVQIYDIKKINGQTKYRAGYPFNWKYISRNNFSRSTCQ